MTTNTPTTLTYTLEEFLERFEQRIDKQFTEVNQKLADINRTLTDVNQKLNRLEVSQADLSAKVSEIEKRLDNQEFINRGVTVAVILALVGGAAKFFGLLPIN